jgi:hypothetical protein
MSLAINQLSQNLIKRSKTIVATTALLLTVGIGSSFATPVKDSDTHAVTTSFHKDFRKAELLQTEVSKNFTKLTFRMNSMVLFAYYADNGQLLAVSRNITSDQLPFQLLMQVKRDFADYWISDLFELTNDGNSNYYITLENADTRLTLRSNGPDWDVYSRTVKL